LETGYEFIGAEHYGALLTPGARHRIIYVFAGGRLSKVQTFVRRQRFPGAAVRLMRA
jgi:hypothetical protein